MAAGEGVETGPTAKVQTLLPIVKANREMAIDYATQIFQSGRRIDMGVLSSVLGVGRTTLYRWVGHRDQLIAEVLARLTDIGWTLANERAAGAGGDRVVSVAREFMTLAAGYEPLRAFARTEPLVALKVLTAPDSQVGRQVREGLRAVIEEQLPERRISDETLDAAVHVATALEWTPIVIGQEPQIDRAVALARSLIDDC